MKKLLRLSLFIIDLVLRYANAFLIFKIVRQKATTFKYGDALDVKWVQLICKNLQQHARKICMRAAVVH
jgi:hypothetical protein